MAPFDDEIDEAAMAEAEAALKALAEEYPAYAEADVEQMAASIAALQAAGGADAGLVAEVYATAHNIKGQGSAFGYDLMTELGEALCTLTRDRAALDAGPLAAAAALIAACRTVLTERLTGDGGVFGAQLRANLGLSLKAA
ncbi:MAG: hypothetical protein QM698_17570 [Micropepsaceae bacterium]